MSTHAPDVVRVNDLLLTISLATGAHWPQTTGAAVQQPVLVSLAVPHNVRTAASTDDLLHTVNYSLLSNNLRNSLETKSTFASLETFAIHVFDTFLGPGSALEPPIQELHIKLVQLKPPSSAKVVGLEAAGTVLRPGEWNVSNIKHFVEDLDCHAIIGVNPPEREEKQLVRLNFCLEGCLEELRSEGVWIDFRGMTRTLYEVCALLMIIDSEHLIYITYIVYQRFLIFDFGSTCK
jgi:dihydroneopterin aldolase/2-amino-4-hydroxy-6-hydroxymethyldihydropteridine diphosphokinase/dihydropteroate synthase